MADRSDCRPEAQTRRLAYYSDMLPLLVRECCYRMDDEWEIDPESRKSLEALLPKLSAALAGARLVRVRAKPALRIVRNDDVETRRRA